jgi:hypothetical protein
LVFALGFFPVSPGPVFLGDLIPLINVLSLVFWYVFQAFRHEAERKKDENSVLEVTGHYFEQNKKVFGFITLCIACLHFLVPVSVLL